ELNIAIKHFDQALWDQTRALILGISSCLSTDLLDISKPPEYKDKMPQDIFEWLSPSHWEVIGLFSSHRHRCFEGTLQWLYLAPELKAWLVSKDGPNLLWVTALPGVGKSIIAAHLLGNLHVQLAATGGHSEKLRQTYLCYFFCKDGEQTLMR